MDEQVNAQHWLDQLICPECKVQYPERTVQYSKLSGLHGHRFYKHGVLDPSLEGEYQRNAEGKFLCGQPDCAEACDNPLLLGKHRWYAHGIRGKTYFTRKNAKAKASPQPKPEKPAPVAKANGVSEAVVVYLFGKVESQIEAYARQYSLQVKLLFSKVGELLQAAGK